jgi:alkylation response protein AidB-like acyl-CoA dehydrogenase
MSRYLPSIVSGDCIATVALAEDDGDFSPSAVRAVAQRSGETFQLDGVKNYVLDGLTASLVIVPALLDGEVSLFGVVGDGLGLTRTPLRTTDQTRKQARLEFRAAEAELIGAQAQGSQIVREMLHVAAVGLAAEQVGGAQKCLDITVEYAKQRYQFGRAIGSFQAIKHKCADMLLAVESARSAAYYAGAVAVRRGDELGIAASLAKAYCSEVFAQVAADCIQVHGGMGFTWDHPASLYFKRAKFDELYLGDPASHAALIAGLLGL